MSTTPNPEELNSVGADLARLRLNAGLKQSKVADLVGVDTSRISRIETGEATPELGEVLKIAQAIGTPESLAYARYLQEEWKELPKPPFWHPARADLLSAEEHLGTLEVFAGKLVGSPAALAEADMLRRSLEHAAAYLQDLDHSVSFVGDIGVGKSTAICAMMDLLIPGDAKKPLRERVVLETGAGGTTVCEVQIRSEANGVFGLVVQPHSDEEVFRTVSDFCVNLLDAPAEAEQATRGVSQEINRAIRNMAQLQRTQSKGPDGKPVRIDPAAELAKTCGSLQELTAEVYRRIKIDQRRQTEFRFIDSDLHAGLKRLRELFSDVNNGRCKEVSLPRRIDLIVPVQLLRDKTYNIRIIDTKGVDGTAIRPDIRAYLDDPRTLTVLCSRYNNAPEPSMQALIENLVNTGAEQVLEQRVAMLVLPRAGEALDMRDDSGISAETVELGYQLKKDQVVAKLSQQKCGEHVGVYFYDVLNDDPRLIAKELSSCVERMRSVQRRRIEEVGQYVTAFIKNHGEEQTKIAQMEVRRQISIFLGRHRHLPDRVQDVHDALISALHSTNARTVWASARRNGSWTGLDAYHFLGTGAAIDAQVRSQAVFSGLDELLRNMMGDRKLAAAHDYLAELRKNIPAWRTKFLTEVTSTGRELFRAVLWEENSLWNRCASRWGGGPGYRDDVAFWIKEWFVAPEREELHSTVEKRVQQAWSDAFVTPLEGLCGREEANVA